MSRPLRPAFPGAIYHVTARGNNKRAIFRDHQDRLEFLILLALVVERYGWIVHGYCLMGNHYHLLIETPRGNISAGMRQLNGCYARAFNARWQQVGHVFQARFHALLVERDGHLLELVRYQALNPVRADPPLCERPEDWLWSSYRAAAGIVDAPPWLSLEWTLAQFGPDGQSARARLIEFVEDGLDRSCEPERHGGLYVGSEAFARERSRGRGPVAEVPRPQWDPVPPTLEEIFARAVDPIATAHKVHGYTMRAIADHLGCHYSAVSRSLRKSERSQSSQRAAPAQPSQQQKATGLSQRKT